MTSRSLSGGRVFCQPNKKDRAVARRISDGNSYCCDSARLVEGAGGIVGEKNVPSDWGT